MNSIDEEYKAYKEENPDRPYYYFLMDMAAFDAGGYQFDVVSEKWVAAAKKSKYFRQIGKELNKENTSLPYFVMSIFYYAVLDNVRAIQQILSKILTECDSLYDNGEWLWFGDVWSAVSCSRKNYWPEIKKTLRDSSLNKKYLLCCDVLQSYHFGSQPKRTIQLAEELTGMDAECSIAWDILGRLQYSEKMWEESNRTHEYILKNFEDHWDRGTYLWRLAWGNGKIKNFALEEKYYREYMKENPDDGWAYNNLGYSFYRQKKYDEAERMLRSSINLLSNKTPYENMVNVLRASGKLSEMREFVQNNQNHLSRKTIENVLGSRDAAPLDLAATERRTMATLKDFQRATVERIDTLFRQGQRRVLVADEVGLGKTLVARGVLVKTARIRQEEGDDLFRVVYICSNQNIANQNIQELRVTASTRVETGNTRLSMEHLLATEQANDEQLKKDFIQLIPLTPETSFKMSGGGGTVQERALMISVLSRMPQFEEDDTFGNAFDDFFHHNEVKNWYSWINQMDIRVEAANDKTGGEYLKRLLQRIEEYDAEKGTIQLLLRHLEAKENGDEPEESDSAVIRKLRQMFAEISVGMLEPDLVIMDEFQRFRSLLDADEDSEMGLLTKHFFGQENLRVLLLSATPYKLYSTLEEIEESQLDEHYYEFFSVINFLFHTEEERQQFKEVWTNYSESLHELQTENLTILVSKEAAENALYQGVCRTERLSAMEFGDYMDDTGAKRWLPIHVEDIRSYLQMGNLLTDIGADFSLPVDYVKSSPYLLSFMHNYQAKKKIERYFQKHPDEVEKANRELLWLERDTIQSYQPLPPVHARLSALLDAALNGKAAYFLWIPPSLPYYEMRGVYKNSQGYSKILVFSAWEMVPRMIGTMLSYEAERLTIHNYANSAGEKATYFVDGQQKRLPAPRLRFNVSSGEPRGMSLFTLLYPSRYLAGLFSPVDCLNQNLSLKALEHQIENALKSALKELKRYQSAKNQRADARWYYLAPMLLDEPEAVEDWLQAFSSVHDEDAETRGQRGKETHMERLREELDSFLRYDDSKMAAPDLGQMPDDLLRVLVDEAIASPAICIFRANGGFAGRASELATQFIHRFNEPEATSIIELSQQQVDEPFWKKLLHYAKDGCFQAMIDEYYHIVADGLKFSVAEEKDAAIHQKMMGALTFRSATYVVDHYASFEKRIANEETAKQGMRMRTHFAVAFSKSEGDKESSGQRKESLRSAFNSPLRPFVLATTSIGQEGLDFHSYCRKVMHWNLPSNPIDIEQREGRVNRYKCLAVRQSIAQLYGGIPFQKNVWEEMFNKAITEKDDACQSELVPYWCAGSDQPVKVERIVPMYPMSQDELKYDRLIQILSLYRLTLGQSRQEGLLEHLSSHIKDVDFLKKLFMNLSPWNRKIKGKVQEN